MQYTQDPRKILNAAGANGIGTPMHVSDFKNVVLGLNTTGTTTATIKFQVSYQKDMPNFAASQSPANQWDYVKVVDLEDASAIDGDTGVALVGADDNRYFEAEVNGANWICAIISGWSQGAVSLTGTAKKD